MQNSGKKPEKEEAVENSIHNGNLSPVDKAMNNLIKMKEATKSGGIAVFE